MVQKSGKKVHEQGTHGRNAAFDLRNELLWDCGEAPEWVFEAPRRKHVESVLEEINLEEQGVKEFVGIVGGL